MEPRTEQSQLYKQIFANMKNGLVVVHLEQEECEATLETVDINPVAMEILGVASADFEIEQIPSCFHYLFQKKMYKTYRDILKTGNWRDLGEICTIPQKGRCFQLHAIPLIDDHLGIMLEEVSLRKRTEETLLSLRRLSSRLHSTFNTDRLLDCLVEEAVKIVEAESGVAGFCTADGISYYRYFLKGRLVSPENCWTPGSPLSCRMIVLDYPYLTNDALNDPYVNPEMAQKFGVRTAISTPIVDAASETIGFLEIHNKFCETGFTGFDQDQLASMAQIAATAMKNTVAFHKLARMGISLRESTERFQLLVEGVDAIVWEADASTWRFNYVSPQAEKILGYPVQRWIVEPSFWVEHINPEDRDHAVQFCRSATDKGEDHRFEYRAVAADGREVWLHDVVRVVKDEAGKVRGLRGIMIDITERVMMMESLRASESRFRSTFQGAGIGMALLDAEARPVESNPALRQLLGYGEEELLAMNLFQLNHPEDRERDQRQFHAMMAGESQRYQEEKRFLRKDGGIVWGRLVVTLLQRGPGEPQFAIAMVEDLTGCKMAEQEVTQLLAKVQQDAAELEQRVQERTAQLQEINTELETFAYTVSHDLRAPLRAVQGFAEIVFESDGAALSQEGRESLQRILAAARRMDLLIQDLLAYSRISREDLIPNRVYLQKVVEGALAHLSLESGEKQYQIEMADQLPEVMGQSAVLTEVVLNLLTNAIKFVAPGTTPRVRIWGEQKGDRCRLLVQDNGIGIAKEHQDRIFNIFERLHGMEVFPGTGVGLAIARKGVQRLGGQIGVDSEVGKGSTFWIELPCANAEEMDRP